MLREGVEISVAVKKDEVTFYTSGGNEGVYGFPYGETQGPESAEISGSLHCNLESAYLNLVEAGEQFPCGVEVAIVCEALQDLGKDEVTDGQRLTGEKGVKAVGL